MRSNCPNAQAIDQTRRQTNKRPTKATHTLADLVGSTPAASSTATTSGSFPAQAQSIAVRPCCADKSTKAASQQPSAMRPADNHELALSVMCGSAPAAN